MSAIPPATRSRGNSSRMMPNANGKMAPPSPWITRAMIMTGSVVARPARPVPAARQTSTTSSTRFLPNMSPEPPGDRRRDRRREQVRGEDPGDAGRRRVEILLQRRQRRHDQGLEHGVRASADGEHCEHEAGTRSRPGGNLRSHPANLPAARALHCGRTTEQPDRLAIRSTVQRWRLERTVGAHEILSWLSTRPSMMQRATTKRVQ